MNNAPLDMHGIAARARLWDFNTHYHAARGNNDERLISGARAALAWCAVRRLNAARRIMAGVAGR